MYYKNLTCFESDKLILSHSLFEYEPSRTGQQTPMAEYQVRLFKKAGFEYRNEEKSFWVDDSSILITYPGEKYSYEYKKRCNVDRFHIRFSPLIFSSDIIKEFPADLYVLPIAENSFLAQLFEKIDFYCSELEGSTLETMLIHTVEEIVCNLVIASKKRISPIEHTENTLFSKISSFIEANIHHPLSLEDICNEFYISKSYLHHIFENQLSISPKKYVLFKKLSYAQQDIRNGKSPTDIYSEYGFLNYSGFYRAYKKCFGYAPSEEGNKNTIISRDVEY
ncbi:MAG: helix-turn-helix transcriptional regulator [Clostridia bacterium]|nr:helix-turn-helix transcriptional regulator [Clostridia bacterium]